MKNQLLLFIFLIVGFCVQSQIVNIPDANFKNALVNYPVADLGIGIYEDVDTNDDGEIQVSEAEAVIRMNVDFFEIASMDGIEFFINLLELECNDNLLTSLDISQNINLSGLYCGNNSITELDVSQNVNLGFLWCYRNDISSLDVSMINLININCSHNNLTELDVSQNENLSTLNISFNNFDQIDVSQNSDLTGLHCSGNSLSNIDVSQNSKLYFLTCAGNELEQLDLTNNQNLVWLQCHLNEPLNYLDLRNGYNQDINLMWAHDTPNLDCVLVDDAVYANSQECGYPTSGWCIDDYNQYVEDIEDCELGLNDIDFTIHIQIYPNPVKDLLTIENTSNTKITSIKIYDVLGRLVLEQNENLDQVSVYHLDSEILFVEIETDQGVMTRKIIKE